MTDILSKAKRSELMAKIKSKNTTPEIIVRKFLFSQGFRFRIHQKNLPGRPDIVLKKYNTVIQVNGCFWHGHTQCRIGHIPKTRSEYWRPKIEGNSQRDKKYKKELKKLGWMVITIWECKLNGKTRQKTLLSLKDSILRNL